MPKFKQLLNLKKSRATFACQINEGGLKVIKCFPGNLGRQEFSGIEFEPISAAVDDKILAEKKR